MGRQQHEKRDQDVGDGREGQERTVRFERSHAELHAWIDEYLQREADDADDGCCEADTRTRHAETPAEMEEARPGFGRGARVGQEGEGEGVEGACVKGEEEMGYESQEDVDCPDLSEGRRLVFVSVVGECWRRRAAFEIEGIGVPVVEVSGSIKRMVFICRTGQPEISFYCL